MSASLPTRRHLLLLAASLPMLSACSLGGDSPRKFGLRPVAPQPAKEGPNWSLAIAVPRALKSLDSERIAHRPDSLELQYYADADWVDRAPLMLQMLMIRSFQNRTRLQVTAQDMPGPLAEFLLTSLLQDFQSEKSNGRITAHIALVASLARSNHRQISQTRNVEASAETTDDHMDSVVAAFDNALAGAMQQLIPWTLAAGEEELKSA